MGAQITKCTNCRENINISDKNCSKCNAVNIRYIDETVPINSDDYLKVKDNFFYYNLRNIEDFLKNKINDDLHKKIFNISHTHYVMWIKHSEMINGKYPDMTLIDLKKTLIKIYKRYYNVYTKELMPPGKVRINPDLTGENFKNRMNLVMKDISEYNHELDTIPDLDK